MNVFSVIVTYNGERWITSCLNSILSSTINVSIIVVDNNSTDNTLEIIKNNFKDIFLIEENKNHGFGIANNIGISYALEKKAEYVFLLNQDVYVEKRTIERLVELIKLHPEYGILSPTHLNGAGSKLDESFLYYIKNSLCKNYISDFILNKEKKKVYSLPMINAAAWMLPKSTFDIVGGFDPIFFLYGEDDNYCQRVLFHKLKIGITPLVKIFHDSDNNFKHNIVKGSKIYFDKFLNRVKVKYADVNSEKYFELNKYINFLRLRSILYLLKLNFKEYNIIRKKLKLISSIEIKKSFLLNRKKNRNYLN